jgi:hypothetical protein
MKKLLTLILLTVAGRVLAQNTNFYDYAPSAVMTTNGMVFEGGATARSFYSWTELNAGEHILLDCRNSVALTTITFGTSWNADLRYIPAAYTLGYSNDGVSFTNVVSVTGNTGGNPSHTISAPLARYWKLTVVSTQPGETFTNIAGLQLLVTGPGAFTNNLYWNTGGYGTSSIQYMGGNVGIGTATPQAKLAVNGDIFAKKVKVTQTGWPDYVFDSSYQLPELKEVAAFIKKHKHLPGIAPAAEVERVGLNLGDNQAALLKKIEELTLYTIDQDKRLQQQQTEIRELRAMLEILLKKKETGTNN